MNRIVKIKSTILAKIGKLDEENFFLNIENHLNGYIEPIILKILDLTKNLETRGFLSPFEMLYTNNELNAMTYKEANLTYIFEYYYEQAKNSTFREKEFTLETADYEEYKANVVKVIDEIPDIMFIDYQDYKSTLIAKQEDKKIIMEAQIATFKKIVPNIEKELRELLRIYYDVFKEKFVNILSKFAIDSQYNSKFKVFTPEGGIDFNRMKELLMYAGIVKFEEKEGEEDIQPIDLQIVKEFKEILVI